MLIHIFTDLVKHFPKQRNTFVFKFADEQLRELIFEIECSFYIF